VLDHHPAVVITSSESMPRNAWRSHRDVVWYLVPPEDVTEALIRLRSAGVDEVELVEPALPPDTLTAAGAVAVTPVHAPVLERLAGTVVDVKLR
jgi:hypothetical protein